MKLLLPLFSVLIISQALVAQQLTGEQLLEKSIAYHDPNKTWETFKGSLLVTMETPKNTPRKSVIEIDLPNEYFKVVAKRDTITTMYSLTKGVCVTSEQAKKDAKRTPCETAKLYQDYYTYLFGLPMKLKDPGTNISEEIAAVTFKGKEYLRLKATYDENVGSDVWYFYFDPQTFAMEVYQFFKGDPNGEGKNTGEYILLTEEKVINTIKFPKNRAWYYNKDDGYLGTDILKN